MSDLPIRHILGVLATTAAAMTLTARGSGEGRTVGEVVDAVRSHDFHPVVDGMTFDRTLNQHGIADPDDNDWLVRTLAVRDLIRAGDAGAAQVTAGLDDANPHVRQLCAMALGIRREATVVPRLIRLLREDPEPFVRSQAAVALGQIGGEEVLPAIRAVRKEDPQRDVRHQCELAEHAIEHGMHATPELAKAYAALDERAFDRVRVGEPAPDFELPDTDGGSWRLSSFRGKAPVALIWVFADWCPVCHREFHELIELREEFARDGIEVATLECHDVFAARVMVGRELEPEYWFSKKSFREEYTGKIWWPHLVDRAAQVGSIYGVRPMAYAVHSEFINRPAVVIVDRDGIVRFAYSGSYWGDRPSIREILEMVRSGRFDFVHPKRLPFPGQSIPFHGSASVMVPLHLHQRQGRLKADGG